MFTSSLITQTRFIDTNGVRLHVETAGPEDGPLVLLLHGFPEQWAGWQAQIGPLARSRFLVAAPDLRGYNLSDRPTGVNAYTLEVLAGDILGIIEAFGRQKAIIAGHDWGGVLAWHLALHHPQHVERLIILNAPHPAAFLRALIRPTTGQIFRSGYIYFFQIPGLPERLLRAGNCFLLKRMTRSLARPGSFNRVTIRRYVEGWRQPGALTAMLNWYRAAVRRSMRLGPGGYRRDSEQRVRQPTLILWGERDPALVRQLAAWSMQWCDQGRLVRFPEASHWVQHDEAARVTAHMIDFLME